MKTNPGVPLAAWENPLQASAFVPEQDAALAHTSISPGSRGCLVGRDFLVIFRLPSGGDRDGVCL